LGRNHPASTASSFIQTDAAVNQAIPAAHWSTAPAIDRHQQRDSQSGSRASASPFRYRLQKACSSDHPRWRVTARMARHRARGADPRARERTHRRSGDGADPGSRRARPIAPACLTRRGAGDRRPDDATSCCLQIAH
jgi:hypothetical protein